MIVRIVAFASWEKQTSVRGAARWRQVAMGPIRSRVDEQFGTEVLDENYPKVSEFRALDIDLRYRYFRNEYSIDDA